MENAIARVGDATDGDNPAAEMPVAGEARKQRLLDFRLGGLGGVGEPLGRVVALARLQVQVARRLERHFQSMERAVELEILR